MTNRYLLEQTGRIKVDGYEELVEKELNELTLEQLEAEYDRLCEADEKLIEASYLIDNIGWLRDTKEKRRRVYSTFVRDSYDKEFLYNNRANRRKSFRVALTDQIRLIETLHYNKYGNYKNLAAIKEKYNKKLDEFFENFKNKQ